MYSSQQLLGLAERLISGTLNREDIKFLTKDPDAAQVMRQVQRSDLLPLLFKVRGQPFSLDNFPQFRVFYDAPYSPDVLYLCGRQVAKSTNLSRYEVLNCMQIPHFQVLYVAPLQGQTNFYSSMYLREAITTCSAARYLQSMKVEDEDVGPVMRSVGHQSFSNGSGIKLTYAKTSADRARGIFCDEIDCDEIQDHLVDNISVIMQSLTQSKWGIRRYTGTAKTMDNTIEFYWQKSSQAEWVIRCDKCNFWNIPNKENKVLDMIQAQGPTCTNCGGLLNVRHGEWVHKFADKSEIFPGYHIPQIVVPNITEDPKKWDELLHKVLVYPVASTYQEILGISSSFGARLITQEDIDKHSTLPSMLELQKRLKQYPVIVGGVDWGIAEQSSFTVHTVIGIRPDGQIHVLWAKRYVGMDSDSMLKDIAQTHRFYKCQLLACDIGMGFTQNTLLAHRFGLPVIQINYCRQQQLLTYLPIRGYPRWMIDKVTALELLFWAIRYDRIWFPPKTESDKYTRDLLSPYQEVKEVGGLETRFFARNPSMPDDFTHALCFAVIGALRLTGSSLLDALPDHAMGATQAYAAQPTGDTIDPAELQRSV